MPVVPFICPHCSLALPEAVEPPEGQINCPGCGKKVTLSPVTDDATASLAASGVAPESETFTSTSPGKNGWAPTGYEVLEVLGQGGMGVVYKARHLSLDRVVALKMILSGVHAAAGELARFQAEAQAVARLQHPHIVQVFDHGIHEGKPYLALEYCESGSLASQLDGTPRPPQRAAALVEQLASAIAAAHQAGIVHRDLKPSNVLLSGQAETLPTPKIADFGLAKNLDQDSGQTRSGSILGTPSYMAPEQALGESKHVGRAADTYALGAILYELLTGRPPFKGAAMLETLEMVRTQEPVPPRRLQPKTPRDLETICLKCLHKDPARRYKSATTLAEDLRRFQQGEPILARPVGRVERLVKWGRRRPAVAGLLLFALFLVAGGLAGFLWAYGQALEQRDQAIAARQETLRTLYFSRVNLAHNEWQTGNVERAESLLDSCPTEFQGMEGHYLKRLCHQEQRSLQLDAWGVEVAYNLDGTRLATATSKTVVIWDLAKDKAIREISKFGLTIQSVALSPDGKYVAVGFSDDRGPDHPGEVGVWEVDTEKLLYHYHFKKPDEGVWSVTFRDDGEAGLRLAAVSGNPNSDLPDKEKGYFVIWSMTTGKVIRDRRIPFGPGFPMGKVVFSPNGKWLAMAVNYLVVVDAETGNDLFPPKPVGVISVAFDKEGTRLAAGGRGSFLLWNTPDGKEAPQQPPPVKAVRCFAFSPDGKKMAWGDHENLVHLWEVGSRKPPRVLRGHRNWVNSIAFSSDGEQLATISADQTAKLWDHTKPAQETRTFPGTVASFGAGNLDLFLGRGKNLEWREVAGEGIMKALSLAQNITALERSQDGKMLALGSSDGLVAIYDLAQQRLLPDLELPGHNAEISRLRFDRSGGQLVSADRDGVIILWDTADRKKVQKWKGVALSPRESQGLAFHPDGHVLVFVAERTSNNVTLAFWDVSSGKKKKLGDRILTETTFPGACAFSPDGRHLALGDRYDIGVWNWQTSPPWEKTSRPSMTLQGHSFYIFDLRYSPDGRRLASLGHDHALRLWDADTGELTLRLLSMNGNFHSRVCFSPGGHHLAVSRVGTGQIQVLDARPWP